MNDSLIENTISFDETPCSVLKGVGPALFERLKRCGIETLQDLLFHLPLRYQDRTRLVSLNQLRVGDTALVEGVIVQIQLKLKPRRSLLCYLQDDTGFLILRFFHFSEYQRAKLKEGMRLRAFGEVRGYGSHRELIHPEYQPLFKKLEKPITQRLTPVYPTTSGLSQKVLNQLTDQVLNLLNQGALLKEYLPALILKKFNLSSLKCALNYVHRPPVEAQLSALESGLHPMQQRLAFEELLAHHLNLKKNRKKIEDQWAPAFKLSQQLIPLFLQRLSFSLTRAQRRVSQEIAADLQKTKPMLRLIQGDVGSGKTVISALAALQVIENGYQVVLMAPTELLADQHHLNYKRWLEALNIDVFFLSGKQKGKQRAQVLEAIAMNAKSMVIGTHALFQEEVVFSNLGLVMVDEQHRFGVQQRLALRNKAFEYPHQLIMSATPIPRTLAMVAYADLDQSIIDELPPGRIPITTLVLSQARREAVIARIREQCRAKRQVYWICTLIEESETLQCQTATQTYITLRQALSELKIGLVHGRLSSQEKYAVMDAFRLGELDVLVSTTVIEVGVDIPHASLMIIENAERLGLAQLHQLRGRVGRGVVASHCVLLYQSPLTSIARERLKMMRETQDGFVIAQRDLELRGPGEVLGTRQTGLIPFRVADVIRDQRLIPIVQEAVGLLEKEAPENIPLLIRRWLSQEEKYARV